MAMEKQGLLLGILVVLLGNANGMVVEGAVVVVPLALIVVWTLFSVPVLLRLCRGEFKNLVMTSK